MTARTTLERVAALRARRAAAGLTEVRGIFLAPEQHVQLKAYATRLARKRPAAPAGEQNPLPTTQRRAR